MGKKRKVTDYYVGDFETTVYEGQTFTEVWASAIVKFGEEDVKIFHSINETFEWMKTLKHNTIIFYHNLKFDGSFWLSYFLSSKVLKPALSAESNYTQWIKAEDMPRNTFRCSISEMNQWYSITIHINNVLIELRDSFKLLPFSVRKIGKDFYTKHQKLEMEYIGFRYAGCDITDQEREYIANDVLVVKEALEVMQQQGHLGLTIGSVCLKDFKDGYGKYYNEYFPDLEEIKLDPGIYGSDNADRYIRNSYHGGWCYVVEGKEKQLKYNGTTADVNSLYPSMMHSMSGNKYPIGHPRFFRGPEEFENVKQDQTIYWFVRIQCRFLLKDMYLPFIQIKRNLFYRSTECLKTSDIYNKKTKNYNRYYIDFDGNRREAKVILTLTMTDYILFHEHYYVFDEEVLDGCYFEAATGIYDRYIDKWKKIKMESKGAVRTIAKLFLNNLYGKMAASKRSNFKIPYVDENDVIQFIDVPDESQKIGYIAGGAAITSYSRNFTIRVAQKNFYGVDRPGFIYADTDSIHCDLQPDQIKGIKVDDAEFCCWKLESCWDVGWFVRQKTYIEHITHEDCKEIEEPYYNVKCAGMNDRCKDLFLKSLTGKSADEYLETEPDYWEKLDDKEKEFVSKKRSITDFDVGLSIPAKIMPKQIEGGVILVNTTYEMR